MKRIDIESAISADDIIDALEKVCLTVKEYYLLNHYPHRHKKELHKALVDVVIHWLRDNGIEID